MPWNPRDEVVAPDQQLARFDGLAGVLHRDGHACGQVFLQVEAYWTRTSGHLWWSRWSAAADRVHALIRLPDGTVTDWRCSGAELSGALADWQADRFVHHGQRYQVRWLDPTESRQLGREAFGPD